VKAPNKKGELSAANQVTLPTFADASISESRTVGTFASQQGFRFFRQGQQQSSRTGRPSSGRKPEKTVNKDDSDYFSSVSKKYNEVVGVKELPGTVKPGGAFFEYGYYQFGVPSFATPGWGIAMEADDAEATSDTTGTQAGDSADDDSTTQRKRGPSGDATGMRGARNGNDGNGEMSVDAKLLKWMDSHSIDGYLDWTTYDHPTLGSVEIGGFKPYEYMNPPADLIQELGPKQGAFVVELASMFARVQIAQTEVTDHGGGVFRIKAEVENAGFFPTSSAHGVVSRSVKPTMVQLDIAPERLLSGAAKTSFFQAMDGSGKRTDFEWIISGKRGDKVKIRAVSQKAGRHEIEVTLR
ncbi:MAG: hypothetical protein HKN13_06185, partial [Rhodothermales bacterium]|nr:hypothetical protein [Rhodothermales bacterium]